MARIQLKNVSRRWGKFVAVDKINLDIADQEFLVLLGPSGCGKTTTMRMIAGLEDVTEGEIWLRRPYNMLGYWNDPSATAEIFDDERWMRTGDIGMLRHGLLYLTTRRSDLILRGGEFPEFTGVMVDLRVGVLR